MADDDVCVITVTIFVAENYGDVPHHPVEAMPFQKISDLKSTIQDIVGIPKQKMTLHFDHEELEDDRQLKDYPAIKDGDILYYSKKGDGKIVIFVKREFPRRETVAMIRAKPSLTILELKQKILKKRGFPMDQQYLFFSGVKLEANASTTLEDYDIKEGSSVLLRLQNEPMKIKLESNGITLKQFRVMPNTKIGSVQIWIQAKVRISISDQDLFFQGTPLQSDRTFRDYGIKDKMAITLKYSFVLSIRPQTGEVISVRVGPETRCEELYRESANRFGIPLQKLSLYAGLNRLDYEYTVTDFELEPGDQIDAMESQSGSISNFTSKPSGDALTKWLILNDQEREEASKAPEIDKREPISFPSQEQLLAEVEKANATTKDSFSTIHTDSQPIVSANDRTRLIKFLDTAIKCFAPGSKDIKITLGDSSGEGGSDALAAILCDLNNVRDSGIAHQTYKALLGLHKHPSRAKIALRRTEGPVDGCIGFHCDVGAKATVQIALNDDSEYDGGKLCFVTGGEGQDLKLSVPKRRAGTITSHGGRILHAVTKLHKGVRYGLFVLDRDIGLGDGDVHCANAESIVRILQAEGSGRSSEEETASKSHSNDRGKILISSF